jgi:hypothetical protein
MFDASNHRLPQSVRHPEADVVLDAGEGMLARRITEIPGSKAVPAVLNRGCGQDPLHNSYGI